MIHDSMFFVVFEDVLEHTPTRTYSFKKHLYRKHCEHLDMISPSTVVTSLPQNPSNPLHDTEYMYKEPTSSCETGVPTSTQQSCHKKQMTLFFLKLKEVSKVSQTPIDNLLCDFTLIIQQVISQLQNDVSTCLQENGLSFTNINGLLEVFSDPLKLYPFTQLESKFLQERLYKNNLDILVSSYRIINHHPVSS